jgi:hypothetical protein
VTTQAEPLNTSSQFASEDNARILRRALKTNAVFSLLSGMLFLSASPQIAQFLGIHETNIFNSISGPTFILSLGIGLLGFASWVFLTATRQPIARGASIGIFVGDAAWVAASVILIVTKALPLTSEGSWGVLIVADIVLTFALWEFVGIRRMAKS